MVSEEILQGLYFNLNPAELPKAYFISMDVRESPESVRERIIAQERLSQREFIEKHILVYLSLETMETEGYRFELKFEGTPTAKLGILPEVGCYKFVSYIDEENHLKNGLLKLTINQNDNNFVLPQIIPGSKKLEKIKFNEQKFNIILETSVAEVQAFGINEKIKIFKMRILKPEREKTREERLKRLMQMG